MLPGDTSLGGSAPSFPRTALDLIRGMGDASTGVRRGSLEELCRLYWKPLYHYLRVGRAKSNEDAKDLTQAFFIWLMEKEPLKRYDPGRGSFRTYMKSLLRHFVQHQDEALQSLKRGGGIRLLDLDLPGGPADSRETDPDRAFDRAWMVSLVDHAVRRVREKFHAKGWIDRFRVFEEYELAPGERPSYADVARRLGFQENEVRSYLFTIRSEVRSEILADLAAMTAGDGELKEEWDAFFKA
jgi:RNA polymerase sigma-70 factor (ECF subfamily)